MNVLPVSLGKKPLIDAVFAVIFDSENHGDVFLPSFFLKQFPSKSLVFEQLEAHKIPLSIREKDENLKNTPVLKANIDKHFHILIGSKILAVGCNMPYQGWQEFKGKIIEVLSVLADVNSINQVSGYHIKYVDVFKESEENLNMDKFKLNISIGDIQLSNNRTFLQTEIIKNEFVHNVTIVTSATASLPDGSRINGGVIDLETHRLDIFSVDNFVKELDTLAETIHDENKSFFFNQLVSDVGLAEMEPSYD